MLGDKLGDESGQTIGMRVLPTEGGARLETSFRATGHMLGVEHTDIGTYVGTMRADGRIHGEGQGVLMGAHGESATWRGAGLGTFKEDGSVSYRGAIYYTTASEAWARLNSVAGVYEYEVDADGTTHGVIWAWS